MHPHRSTRPHKSENIISFDVDIRDKTIIILPDGVIQISPSGKATKAKSGYVYIRKAYDGEKRKPGKWPRVKANLGARPSEKEAFLRSFWSLICHRSSADDVSTPRPRHKRFRSS